MSHDYYYRGPSEEEEVIIQAVDDKDPLSIRVTDDTGETVCVTLPEEEIDRLIAGLQAAQQKIKTAKAALPRLAVPIHSRQEVEVMQQDDECDNCHCGTLEEVDDGFNCRGECGAFFPKEHSNEPIQ